MTDQDTPFVDVQQGLQDMSFDDIIETRFDPEFAPIAARFAPLMTAAIQLGSAAVYGSLASTGVIAAAAIDLQVFIDRTNECLADMAAAIVDSQRAADPTADILAVAAHGPTFGWIIIRPPSPGEADGWRAQATIDGFPHVSQSDTLAAAVGGLAAIVSGQLPPVVEDQPGDASDQDSDGEAKDSLGA